jgi:hypothetical protein
LAIHLFLVILGILFFNRRYTTLVFLVTSCIPTAFPASVLGLDIGQITLGTYWLVLRRMR